MTDNVEAGGFEGGSYIYVIYPCQSPNCGSDKTKPTLHVHVMIIMFINSLCHVMFYHVHSCSCHVYIISSSWAFWTHWLSLDFFFYRSADLHVFVLGCVSSGEPKSTRIWKVGMSAWPELTAKKRVLFSSKMRRMVLKTYGDPFCEKGVNEDVSLASFRDGKWNDAFIYIYIIFVFF